ncbi:hypothetical protein [Mycobacteroides abscessus]|uniref:hypothetical protein n=1 Tax=Mycobacteroides abscessus TaxID=36809 RepID=UPI00092C8322|nr:hypothetical protein [Mycobacteroides abscessus]SIF24622.1 Uncharacterised protein [Mycobacteroides abscessus subsp. abscessus]SIF38245.1 Uncharacterised protein [Mycobacteroides abscessus subsp. abscessus]SIF84423.1 Uncharacterised protein [Mycobacteroides abscessus subsp. abscessus]
MTWTDPDFSAIYSHAAATGSAARIADTQSQVGATAGKLAGAAGGSQPENLAAGASEVGAVLSGLATDAALTTSIWGDLKKAADAWKASAPTADELNAAEKAVTEAVAASTAANEKADAPGTSKADQDAADAAGAAGIAAKEKLIELKRKRTEANKTFREALGRAITKAKGITGGREKKDTTGGGYGNGKPTTGTGTPAGSASGTGSGGTPAAKAPGSIAPGKTPGTATPAAATPETKASSGGTTDPSALLSALSKQNQQPQAQTQQAAAQPQAAAQTPQQQPQNQQARDGKDDKHSLATDGILGVDDVARLTGEAGTAGAVGAAGLGAALANAGSPASGGPSTQYRPAGTPIAGTTSGGTPAQSQPAPTTGTSRTDLVTGQGNTEVSGRSEPARTATDPAPGTKLSSADPVNQVGARPGATAPGGMPMSPGMVGAPLSSPAASNQKGQRDERTPITAYPDEQMFLLHGGDTLSEATRYTIAQNRPSAA